MKQRFFLILFSFFSLSGAEIALPSIFSKPELYAGLVTASALYTVYDVYVFNKDAKKGNQAVESALLEQKNNAERNEENDKLKAKELEDVNTQSSSAWILLNISEYAEDKKQKKIALLRNLSTHVSDIFDHEQFKKSNRHATIRDIFESKDDTVFENQDLDGLHTKLSSLIFTKVGILRNKKTKNNNIIEKKFFESRSYKSTIPLLILASLFWIPTIIKLFGYKIRFSDQTKRGIPSLNFDTKEIAIPSLLLDPRLYMIGFSLIGCGDLLRIGVRNGKIRKENREIEIRIKKAREDADIWNDLRKNQEDDEMRKTIKIGKIKELYRENKDLLLAQEKIFPAENKFKNVPNLKKLNKIFALEKPEEEFQSIEELYLDLYHTLIISTDTSKQELLEYRRPFIWFSASNCVAFYAVFFDKFSKDILHVQRS